MRNFILLAAISSLILISCGGEKNNNNRQAQNAEAKGGRVYGGCIRIAESETWQSLSPISIVDATSSLIATQIHDGLVKFNTATLKVVPSIAEKWEIDAAGTKYTFHIRKGVYFQDDECFPGGKGREVKASDFKYSFDLICTKGVDNVNFSSTFKDRIKGANEFYEGKGSLDAVKVLDDYTLEITLEHPSTVFIQILAEPTCAVVAKEAVDKYGKNIKTGAGPFIFDAVHSTKDKVVLTKNQNYFSTDSLGNRLPFLDSVVVLFIPTKEQELALFKDGKIDMITSLPSQSIKEMVETQIKDFQSKPPKYLLDNSAEMISQYYTFNVSRPPFDNPDVRRSFNMAINRKKIVEEILNNQAFGAGINGITPPTFLADGYDISKIKGYDYDPEMAKKLLAKAGYPNGRAFPPIKIILNSGGAKHSNIVVEIQKQLLEVLNVNVDFDVVPMSQKLEQSQMGQMDIVRDAWVADYPSPESFLSVFYGANVPKDPSQRSFPNTARYKNAEFDKYFCLGRDAKSKDSSNVYFMKAEQILMNDAPIMVLWYDGNYRLTQYGVRNAYNNAMRYRNFADVFIKSDASSATADKKDSVAK
ncbi:MAG TPA: peptide ABC transporter substrate-binding protein [Bacteroidia bacterium]|nr:peptide ABC transporter substrate-binding protein [Bacteroidia bacterium]